MEPLPQRTFNLLLIGIGAGIVVLAFGTRWYIDSLETNRQARETAARGEMVAQISQIREDVNTLERVAGALVANNKAVANQLASEQAKREAAERARAAENAVARAQITQLQQNLDEAKGPDVSAIISKWRPKVVSITCKWNLGGGRIAEGMGSGTLATNTPFATILTNRHVVVYGGATADSCTLKFPGDVVSSVVATADIAPSGAGSDWAKIFVRKPTAYVAALASDVIKRCTTRAAIGEPLVILGYPGIGAQGDVTATEGIISGYDGDYYISSAKVERGNSGGAAILEKQNCYLGMPTFVDVGQLETLARILDQKLIP